MNIRSLRTRLLLSFYLVAILPIIIISVISFGKTIKIIEGKVTDLTQINLQQVSKNIELTLDGYEDLLFQLYTDDEVIEIVDNINSNQNRALYVNQLLTKIRETANIKPYIESVMIIPKNGNAIFIDKLTAATTKSSWLDSYDTSEQEIYDKVSKTNQTIVLPTKYASTIAGKEYYLFHTAHRLIDYQNINKEIGIVIFSLNESILNQICNESNMEAQAKSINFLLNENNEILSFPNSKNIGKKLSKLIYKGNETEKVYREFINDIGIFKEKKVLINSIFDEDNGWTIVNIADKEFLLSEIAAQKRVVIIVVLLTFVVLICVSSFVTTHLTASINNVVKVMKTVSNGNLSARVKPNKKMPEEIEIIARQFDYTMEQLEDSIEKERTATLKQKDAEIKFLEAQINPHFLYNTLDTINWMAIDEEKYEISSAINALAHILRYGIENNNKTVPISKEVEWLKKYIFLQQSRIKDSFECQIRVEPQLMECYIHKLLLQPFVENAIIHGFDKTKGKFRLEIVIRESDDKLEIVIRDNGKGMKEDVLRAAYAKTESETDTHIGIRNAVSRIHMYYGDTAFVVVESTFGEGTEVKIGIPKTEGV